MPRSKYLDMLKGTVIILVTLFHTVAWNSDNQTAANSYLLNSLMPMLMPTFFGISGFLLYFSKVDQPRRWIADKAKYLLIPHFAIDFLMYFCSLIGFNRAAFDIHGMSLADWLYRTVIRDDGEWFCWAFFFILLLTLLIKISDGSRKFWPVLIGLLLIVTFSPGTPDWLHTVHIQWYFPFTVIGYLLARHWPFIKKRHPEWVAYAGAAAFIPFMFLTNWKGSFVARSMLDNYYWLTTGHLLEGPTIFFQSMFGVGLIMTAVFWKSKAKVFYPLAFFGRYSFAIYILQEFLLLSTSFGSSWLGQGITFVWTLALCVGAIFLLRHVKILPKWFPPSQSQIVNE
jgi:fucose 4-O-acetylase-like acetyltransferase